MPLQQHDAASVGDLTGERFRQDELDQRIPIVGEGKELPRPPRQCIKAKLKLATKWLTHFGRIGGRAVDVVDLEEVGEQIERFARRDVLLGGGRTFEQSAVLAHLPLVSKPRNRLQSRAGSTHLEDPDGFRLPSSSPVRVHARDVQIHAVRHRHVTSPLEVFRVCRASSLLQPHQLESWIRRFGSGRGRSPAGRPRHRFATGEGSAQLVERGSLFRSLFEVGRIRRRRRCFVAMFVRLVALRIRQQVTHFDAVSIFGSGYKCGFDSSLAGIVRARMCARGGMVAAKGRRAMRTDEWEKVERATAGEGTVHLRDGATSHSACERG